MNSKEHKEWLRKKYGEDLICEWTPDFDGSVWNTSCGEAFCFEVGTPSENHYRFCPYCGKELKENLAAACSDTDTCGD